MSDEPEQRERRFDGLTVVEEEGFGSWKVIDVIIDDYDTVCEKYREHIEAFVALEWEEEWEK